MIVKDYRKSLAQSFNVFISHEQVGEIINSNEKIDIYNKV